MPSHGLIAHFFLFLNNIPFFQKDFYLFTLERGEGKEKERERNISVRLPLTPPTGDLARDQACVLTGDRTVTFWLEGWHSNRRATPARAPFYRYKSLSRARRRYHCGRQSPDNDRGVLFYMYKDLLTFTSIVYMLIVFKIL